MNAHLIYNPEAGQRDGHRQVLEIVDLLSERGWRLVVRETKAPADVTEYAGQAVIEGVDAVLAMGGDGTVNGAANSLAGTNVALGVLPMGTGNVWAAELGLIPIPTPLYRPDPVAAARRLSQGGERWIDLGRVKATAEDGSMVTRYFVLWAGVGFDAAVARVVERQLRQVKRRLGALSFVMAGLDTVFRYRGTWATLRFNDHVLEERVVLVLVSNAQLYAGTVRLAPDSRLDDGLLSAHIFKGRGTPAMIRHVLSVLLRRHRRDPNVATYDIRRMTVETVEPLPVHVDAEPIGTTPIQLEVVPQVLKILVPEKVPAALSSKGGLS